MARYQRLINGEWMIKVLDPETLVYGLVIHDNEEFFDWIESDITSFPSEEARDAEFDRIWDDDRDSGN